MLTPEVAPGIHRVEDCFTNWYLVETGGRLTVVDAGVPTSWKSLHEALSQLGRKADDIEALVLTHAHYDHVGFAEKARKEFGIPVHVHTSDVALTKHPWRYDHERPRAPYFVTKPKTWPVVAAFTRARAFFPAPLREVERFESGELDVPGTPKVIFTPGHTQGHCSLHFPDRDTVIAGDAVVTFNPYLATTGPQIVSGAATADSERNLASLDALAATGAKTVLTGHGEPWTDGVETMVEQARAAGPS